MKVNKTQAELVLKKEAELATAGNVSAGWVELVETRLNPRIVGQHGTK